MPKKATAKLINETVEQVGRRYAREILRLIHPTVAPYTSDVTKVAEVLARFHDERKVRGRS